MRRIGSVDYKKVFEIVEICAFNSDKIMKKLIFVFDDCAQTDNTEFHKHAYKTMKQVIVWEIQ